MATKRKNGEGTIYQRSDGLWRCEITIGYNADGKRIKKTLSSKDLDTLKKKINDSKYLKDRQMLAQPNNITIGEWLDFWLENYKLNTVKPRSYDMYHNVCKVHLKPQFGKLKLDKLSTLMIQHYINSLSKTHSPSSIKKIYLALSQAYEQAIKLDMLYKNPCKGVVLPPTGKTKATAFTVEQQKLFTDLCNNTGSTYDNLFIFALNTGMRLGEILALQWSDVHDGYIVVSKNLQTINDYSDSENKQKIVISSTKSENIRTIPLSHAAQTAINNQRTNNKNNSAFVFCSLRADNTPVESRNVRRNLALKFKKMETEYRFDMEGLSFHSMRHSFATRLLEKGADIKTVSELLGHKSIQITLDIYSHVSQGLKQSTIDLLND